MLSTFSIWSNEHNYEAKVVVRINKLLTKKERSNDLSGTTRFSLIAANRPEMHERRHQLPAVLQRLCRFFIQFQNQVTVDAPKTYVN